jgi:16S rRNA (adenine1518-N6/adenine1519-N6)-dimethyltransferase
VPPKSKLGQNFLRDQQAIRRIVAALGDCSRSTVIEIGPGRGAITQELAANVEKLIALEVDPALAANLSNTYEISGASTTNAVSIETVDVLSFDFKAAASAAGQRLVVVGNLPYYITSPILTKLASSSDALDRAVLMVQREVADRVTAQPGSRDYGLLSVAVQLHGPVESLFTLPPSAFSPPPEVYSTVFRWRFASRFAELALDRRQFLAFLRQIFALKRKTLMNNLRAAGYAGESISSALEDAGIDPRARAEAVSISALAALWKSLHGKGATPQGEMAPEITQDWTDQ